MKSRNILLSFLTIVFLFFIYSPNIGWATTGYVCDPDPSENPGGDLDRDEIINRDDLCPLTRGVRLFNGCIDSDRDGIQDYWEYYNSRTCLMERIPVDMCRYSRGPGINTHLYGDIPNGCPNVDCMGDPDPGIDVSRLPTDVYVEERSPPHICPETSRPHVRQCFWSSITSDMIFRDVDCDGTLDEDELFEDCALEPGPKIAGGCPDADEDGIPDRLDRCPDRFGVNIYTGCPEADRDGDFVHNTPDIDRCPDIPGEMEYYGCPEFDRDGDGVRNDTGADFCPDVAGVAGSRGCPAGDRDGDGIMDTVDLCPEEPGRGGDYRGCTTITDEPLLAPMPAPRLTIEPMTLPPAPIPPPPEVVDIRPVPLIPTELAMMPEAEAPAGEEAIPGPEAERIPVGEEEVIPTAPGSVVSDEAELAESTEEELAASRERGIFGGGACSLIIGSKAHQIVWFFILLPVMVLRIRKFKGSD